MHGDSIAIFISLRSGNYRSHRHNIETADSLERLFDLSRFDFELVLVTDVLVAAPAASTEVRTFGRDAMRGRFEQGLQLRFSEMLFLANNSCRDAFAINRIGNEDCLAVFARDAFPAKGDVFDLQLQSRVAPTYVGAAFPLYLRSYSTVREEASAGAGPPHWRLNNPARRDISIRCRARAEILNIPRGCSGHHLAEAACRCRD